MVYSPYWALMVYRVFVLELPIGGTNGLVMAYKTTYTFVMSETTITLLALFNFITEIF